MLPPKTNMMTPGAIAEKIKLGYTTNSPVRATRIVDVNGKLYAMMPYMDGGDGIMLLNRSRTRLRKNAADRASMSLGIMHRVGTQLQDLHAKGFVHADVKPENMLSNRQGALVLTALGGMRKLHRSHYAKGAGLSAPYLAPERLLNLKANFTAAVDILGLGVSLLDAYTAHFGLQHNPFAAPDAMAQFHAVRADLWPLNKTSKISASPPPRRL